MFLFSMVLLFSLSACSEKEEITTLKDYQAVQFDQDLYTALYDHSYKLLSSAKDLMSHRSASSNSIISKATGDIQKNSITNELAINYFRNTILEITSKSNRYVEEEIFNFKAQYKFENQQEDVIITRIIDLTQQKNFAEILYFIDRLKSSGILWNEEISASSKEKLFPFLTTIEASIQVFSLQNNDSNVIVQRGANCWRAVGESAVNGAIWGLVGGLYHGCKTGLVLGFNPGSAAAGCMGGMIVGTIGGAIGGAITGGIGCLIFN